MPLVRLISTKNRCLVTMRDVDLSALRYVALSYVWGRAPKVDDGDYLGPQLELRKDTEQDLHDENSLAGNEIPSTILDSINLAGILGFDYIWVDRLCIRQDSLEDKASQLSKMHAIYNAAYLTIVAAAGADANFGLPGLSPNSRMVEQKEIMVLDPCPIGCVRAHHHDYNGISL
jgi:hypothetical protein